MYPGGLSVPRLDRLHRTMNAYVERGVLPGVVTAIARHGDVQLNVLGDQAFGGPPMCRDTIFRIASMTKPVTAVAALILLEECRLRLDDPVDELLPELADRRVLRRPDGPVDDTVAAERAITVRDLLTLRLGIGLLWDQDGPYPIHRLLEELDLLQGPPRPETTPGPDAWIGRVAGLPLMYQPGERWLYDLGIDILGVLIERATSQTLEAFCTERIFEPLGMRDTGFSVPTSALDRFATSYATDPRTGAPRVYDEPSGQWSRPPAFRSGSAGLVSTADDYLTFGRMLANLGVYEGGGRLLSRTSVEAMTTNQLTAAQAIGTEPFLGSNRGWGLGVSVVTHRDGPSAVPGTFGWEGGLGTSWATDPTEDLVAVLLTQRTWDSPSGPTVYRDFWASAYQAIDD